MRKLFTILGILAVLSAIFVLAAKPNPGHSASEVSGGTFYDDSTDFVFPNNVGIGASPYGPLYVYSADAGAIGAVADADELVIENSGNAGLSILTPTASVGSLVFGSPNDGDRAFVRYDHNTEKMEFATSSVIEMVIDTAGQVGIGTNSPAASLNIREGGTAGATALLIDDVDNEAVAVGINVTDENGNPIFTAMTSGAGDGDQGRIGLNTPNVPYQVTIGKGHATQSNYISYSAPVTSTEGGLLQFYTNNAQGAVRTLDIGSFGDTSATAGGGEIRFIVNDVNDATPAGAMVIKRDGDVGIGTATPDATLNVVSSSGLTFTPYSAADDLVVENNGASGMSLVSTDATSSRIAFASPSAQQYAIFLGSYNGGEPYLATYVDGAERMRVNASGFVAIGDTEPRAKLDVNGAIRIRTGGTSSIPPCTTLNRGTIYQFQPTSQPANDRLCYCAHTGLSIYKWIDLGTGTVYDGTDCE